MTTKKALTISICVFMIVAVIALLLILSKGHIGSKNLVNIGQEKNNSKTEETIMPKLEISTENQYISSKDKESTKLIATIDGETITNGITYTSSDETIAKIKDGEVVAVKEGRAEIKGVYEGIEATTDIQVIIPIKSMKFTSTSSSIKVGKELQMKLKVTPSDATITPLTYSSSDENIATVNNNGIVTGVSKGKVTITVTDAYTGKQEDVSLTIK